MTPELDQIDLDAAVPSAEETTRVTDPAFAVMLRVALVLVILILGVALAIVLALSALRHAPRTTSERDIAAAEASVKAKPSDVAAWTKLAYAYADAKRFDDAYAVVRRARKATSDPVVSLVDADILRMDGRFKDALTEYDGAYTAISEAEAAARQRREQLGIYTQIGDDTIVRVLYGRALVRHELKDTDGAIEDLETAVKRSPEAAYLSVVLGDYYAEEGRRADAAAAYRRALTYVPDYAEALAGLAKVEGEATK